MIDFLVFCFFCLLLFRGEALVTELYIVCSAGVFVWMG